MTFLRQEYDKHFGGVSERQRATYVQVWHSRLCAVVC